MEAPSAVFTNSMTVDIGFLMIFAIDVKFIRGCGASESGTLPNRRRRT
jgi:hypothetical protein